VQIRSIQILRGVAAIAVLLVHINLWELHNFGTHAVTPVIFSNGAAGVDLFFVISGFIMVFIQSHPIDSPSSYLRFMIHRVTRIYPPVWMVMLLLLPVWLVRPELFNNYYHNHVDVFRSFLLLPQDYTPLLSVAWTLIHEVYFYLVVSFALMFAARGRWMFGCAWFLIVLVIFRFFGATGFHQIRILQLIFSPFSLNFLLGYFIGLSYLKIRKAPLTLALVFLGTGLAGIGFGLHVSSTDSFGVYPDNNNLSRFFTWGVPAALLVASAIAWEARLPKPILRLDFFGDISYATYLIHVPFVTLYYLMLSKLHVNSPAFLGIAAVVCLVSCLMISAVFHFYLELKITRKCREFLENQFRLKKS
jgi:peptidoglycan/LPS O-acetylase OafA/YrhL